jgi:hypothetical protein
VGRKVNTRETHKTYVVLGDGLTEQYYLKHLKTIKGYKYAIRPSLFASITIQTAEGIIDDYVLGGCDQVIYFTDYDTIVNQDKLAIFEKLKNKYAETPEVLICESMPSIEFWFLLHYQKTTREFCNANEVLIYLSRHLKDYSKSESYLRSSKWVEELFKNGNIDIAIKNSKIVLTEKGKNSSSHFPFTKVHLALEYFEKQKS